MFDLKNLLKTMLKQKEIIPSSLVSHCCHIMKLFSYVYIYIYIALCAALCLSFYLYPRRESIILLLVILIIFMSNNEILFNTRFSTTCSTIFSQYLREQLLITQTFSTPPSFQQKFCDLNRRCFLETSTFYNIFTSFYSE